MTQRWAVCLPREVVAALGRLRRVLGLRVCDGGGAVWLQGDNLDETLALRLRALPGARRYAVLDTGQLIEAGTRVPCGRLPDGPWPTLPAWLEVHLDPAALAGGVSARLPVCLVRSAVVLGENVLLAALAEWTAYASSAPQLRLERWSFAVNNAGMVVVRGEPAPSIPGQRFVEREGVAVPAGWAWEPAVDAVVLRELLGLQTNDLALLHPDGAWEHVPADGFTRASRSAIRLSARGASDV